MIVLRVYRGVADHFPIRVTEWVMALPALGMFVLLQLDPIMFTRSPSYEYLARWANESTWALIIAGCGITRLAALTINGTFHGFVWSPHIRAAASLVGVTVWSQISLGFLIAAIYGQGAGSGVIGWSSLAIIEIVNVYRSWSDVGKHAQER